jgi:DHA2 family multidrug resistance protein-like MFS transporter
LFSPKTKGRRRCCALAIGNSSPPKLVRFVGCVRLRGENARVSQSRTPVIVATSIGTLLSMLDQTIANTALPTIAHDVNATASASIWVINAYQLALTVAIVPLTSLGDIVGYVRLYNAGLALFVIASVACVFSHSLEALVIARFVQGLAGAAMTATTGPIMRNSYPPAMLGRATGYNAMAVALGAAAGPIVSGCVLSVASWPWLFALNIPIGLAALALSLRYVVHQPGSAARFDAPSAGLSIATFGLALFGFDGFGHQAPLPVVAAELLAAAVVGTIFIRRQRSLPLPMFGVDLFARPPFTLAVVACYASFVAQTIAYVALPFSFQTVMGRSPLEVGELLLPWLLASALVAPFAGRLADRFTSSRLAATGLAIFAGGLLLLTLLPAHAATPDIVWRMLVCGIGYGLFQSPNNRSIQGSAPRERSGAPQAIQAVARLTGQTSGAIIVSIVFSLGETRTGAASGATASSISAVMTIATVCALLAAGASVWRGALTGSIRFARA